MGIEQRWTSAANVFVALITTYGLRILGAILILIGGWVAARLLYAVIVRLCEKSGRLDLTITYFLANATRYTTLIFTFIAVLTTFGIETTSFVAVLGALGLAIGLALQGTLSNFAAGIMLILFRPFHIGDQIETTGIAGQIVSGTTRMINLFFTEIDTEDNVRVIIPNGMLWGQVVRVPTRNDRRRLDIRVQRPANDDVGGAIARLKDVIGRDRRVNNINAIGVEALNDNGYVLAAQIWVHRREYANVRFDLNRAVREEFNRQTG
jgi:small conductance mechanosensitive channel